MSKYLSKYRTVSDGLKFKNQQLVTKRIWYYPVLTRDRWVDIGYYQWEHLEFGPYFRTKYYNTLEEACSDRAEWEEHDAKHHDWEEVSCPGKAES